MPRFVILEHVPVVADGKPLHWDFMLETGDSLRTWALCEPPSEDKVIEAEQLASHRLAYLDFEGPLTNDRGIVHQWDSGTFVLVEDSGEEVIAQLHGRKLDGAAVLERTDNDQWTFQFRPTGKR